MAVVIKIQFLAGRFHATPWDKQVNEGVVEWPPSPWRILRSLVSAYYRLSDRPERLQLLNLMVQLAAVPPSYQLPAVTAAHTRHYMPLWKNGEATTTKVLDTFYALPGGAFSSDAIVRVIWPEVELSQADLALLRSLCAGVGYLGRAESWVEMGLIEDGQAIEPNARPIDAESEVKRWETVGRVLVPFNQQEMQGFVATMAALPRPKQGRGWWQAPQDVLEALEVDIGGLRQQGWNGVPGSRWALYGVQSAKPVRSRSIVETLEGTPAIARFALSGRVLPRMTAAISVGERFHQALMARSQGEDGRSVETFTGRDAAGNPLVRNHAHAWYLPDCNDRGEITHMLVYGPSGFDPVAMRALQGLKQVWGSEGFDVGTDLLAIERVQRSEGSRKGVMGRGRRWRSLTPFVLARFPKRKAIAGSDFLVDGPEDQALRFLGQLPHLGLSLGDDAVVRVEGDWLAIGRPGEDAVVRVRCCAAGETGVSWVKFQRSRRHGNGSRGGDRGFWLEVEFGESVVGPLAIGYGAHFGLGLLVCADGE